MVPTASTVVDGFSTQVASGHRRLSTLLRTFANLGCRFDTTTVFSRRHASGFRSVPFAANPRPL